MADVIGQSDIYIDDPFSDCSIASLLPRTLGGSISAGAAMSESDYQDFVGNLFKSMKLKNCTQLVENAKLISDSSCSSFPNSGPEKEDNILARRTFGDQIELQGANTKYETSEWRSTRNMKKPTERDLYGLEHDNLCLPENTNVVDEQVEAPCNILNGSSKNQRHLDASGVSRRKKFKRKEQILKRKRLAGVGTVWEAGVRRSTRIRMKPLLFWCG